MTHSPTLSPDRFEQIRTFLTEEAATAPADSRGRLLAGSRRRGLAVGAAALTLSGVLAVTTLRPGGTEAALAVTVEDGWTVVRLSDVDADAQAVRDELVAAGIDARIGPVGPDPDLPSGQGLSIVGVVGDLMLPDASYGLSIVIPGGTGPTGGAGPVGESPPLDTGPVDLTPDDPDLLEQHGVRIGNGEDVSFSIRAGSDAVVVVHPRR
jgi:hypothetical protein